MASDFEILNFKTKRREDLDFEGVVKQLLICVRENCEDVLHLSKAALRIIQMLPEQSQLIDEKNPVPGRF